MAIGTLVANLPVGGAGRLFITDDGTNIRFYVGCSDPQTRVGTYFWGGSIGNVAIDGNTNLPAGFGEKLLWQGPVQNTLTVRLRQGDTGTWGLGPAAGDAVYNVVRQTVPAAPTFRGFINPTLDGITIYFGGNSNGGSPILEYRTQIATAPDLSEGLQSKTGPAGTGTHSYTGLGKTTNVWGRAQARNALGWGPWSAIGGPGLTLGTISDKAPAPRIESIGTTTVTYYPDNPTYIGEGPYKRVVQVLHKTLDTVIAEQVEPARPSTFTGLTRGTDYRLRQRIDNKMGTGPWSNTIGFTTSYAPTAAPTDYIATDIASTSAWSTVGALTDNGGRVPSNMRVQVAKTVVSGEPGPGFTDTQTGFYGQFPMTGLDPSTLYNYRVMLNNGAGWSPWGAWKQFTTKGNVPRHPLNPVVSSITGSTALIDWDPPSGLLGATLNSYVLRLAENKALTAGIRNHSLSPDEHQQALGNLKSGTTYYYAIWSTSSNGLGSTTAIGSFTTTGAGTAPKPLWHKVASVWRNGIMWHRVGGTWYPTLAWHRVSGVWKNN